MSRTRSWLPTGQARTELAGPDLSDADLAEAVRNGDTDAFAELWRRHHAAALRVARRDIPAHLSAEDVVAEAFTGVLVALRNGNGPTDNVSGYLFTAVRNAVARGAQAAARQRPVPDEDLDRPVDDPDPLWAQADEQLIRTAYLRLPRRWREVLYLLDIEQVPPREAAATLGLSANGVASLALRARARLRVHYLTAHLGRVAPGCQPYAELLGAFAQGTASRTASDRVSAHLATCESCREALGQLADFTVRTRAALLPLGGAGFAVGTWRRRPTRRRTDPRQRPGSTARRTGRGRSRAGRRLGALVAGMLLLVSAAMGAAALVSDLTTDNVSATGTDEPATPTDDGTRTSLSGRDRDGHRAQHLGLPTAASTPEPPSSGDTEAFPPTGSAAPVTGATAGPAPSAAASPAPSASGSPSPTTTRSPTTLTLAPLSTGSLLTGRRGIVTVAVQQNTSAISSGALTAVIRLPDGVTVDQQSEHTTSTRWSCHGTGSTATCHSDPLSAGASSILGLAVHVAPDAVAGPATITVNGPDTVATSATWALAPSPRGLTAAVVATGNLKVIEAGAPLLSCAPTDPGCDALVQGTQTTRPDNGQWSMTSTTGYRHTDLDLPTGGRVVSARLYWTGACTQALDALSPTLMQPDGTGVAVTDQVSSTRTVGAQRTWSADVTDIIATGGAGTWSFDGECTTPGTGQFGGWGIVAVVDTGDPADRSTVTILEGPYAASNDGVSTQVATPTGHQVEIGAVAWDGDRGLTGDRITLDGTALTPYGPNGDRSPDNAFDSTALGSGVANSLGTDVTTFRPVTATRDDGTLSLHTRSDLVVLSALVVRVRE